jgi:hypothetical protein
VLYALANGVATELDRAFNLDYNTAHLYLVRKAMESRFNHKLSEIIRNKQ